jgi:sugar phosphate isomerase/epimerase
MRALSLDHLTAFEMPPPELVSIAAELGCQHVSLWTQQPMPGSFPLVDRSNLAETKRRLNDTGVTLRSVECFNLMPDVVVDDFRPALELGAELGGKAALAINYMDPDESRCADNFARLCALAATFGLGVNVEFIAMGYVRTPADAQRLIERSGATNAAINCDLLHVVRSDSSPADIARLPPSLIGYGQICDGPLQISDDLLVIEGMQQRQIPGEGEFPVGEFLAALPPEVIVGVEVPLKKLRDAGVPALERARRAMAGTRAALDRFGRW